MRRKSSSWVGIEADRHAGRESLDVPSIDQLELARTVIAIALLSLFQLPSSRANPFQEAAERRGRETTALIIRAPQRRCFARTIC
jgi:hypothetical protein